MPADDRKPLTTADLYGGSAAVPDHPTPVIEEGGIFRSAGVPESREAPRDAAGNLLYEETPIIEPLESSPLEISGGQGSEPPPASPPEQASEPELPERQEGEIPPPYEKRPSRLRSILIFFIIFILGIGASVLYRNIVNFLGSESGNETGDVPPAPTPSPFVSGTPAAYETVMFSGSPVVTPVQPDQWALYTVWQGGTKTSVGVTYRLPPEMREPVCDGTGCVSAGSYMPGGTRFTVAYYRKNILTPMFSQTQVTDAAGRKFETKEASVSGKPALAFSGSFSGSTTGGYRFTRMSGVMIAAGPDTTIEVNHFSPAGVNADFDKDEELFTGILKTFSFE